MVENTLGKAIHPLMTRHTVVAPTGDMTGDEIGLVTAMAHLAQCPIKMGQILDVTIGAGKRLTGGCHLVLRQRKAEHLVRKGLEIHAREGRLGALVFGMASTALQAFRQRAVQGIGVFYLRLDVGVASQTPLLHFFAAPGRGVAGRAASADFGMRGHAAQPQAFASHRVERTRVEHHAAGCQCSACDSQHRDDSRDDA